MILLGTGDDGHVGSIYPDSDEAKAIGAVVLPIVAKNSVAVSLDFMSAAASAMLVLCTARVMLCSSDSMLVLCVARGVQCLWCAPRCSSCAVLVLHNARLVQCSSCAMLVLYALLV